MGEEADADWQEGLIEWGRKDAQEALRPYKDPKCPKCGIVLGNKMSYACRHSHCPSGLN